MASGTDLASPAISPDVAPRAAVHSTHGCWTGQRRWLEAGPGLLGTNRAPLAPSRLEQKTERS